MNPLRVVPITQMNRLRVMGVGGALRPQGVGDRAWAKIQVWSFLASAWLWSTWSLGGRGWGVLEAMPLGAVASSPGVVLGLKCHVTPPFSILCTGGN